jgi:hypothetical protein
MSKKKESIKYE